MDAAAVPCSIDIEKKYEMLNTLSDIETAQSMQKNRQTPASGPKQQPHPSDLNYQQLAADLSLLDPAKDDDYKIIQNYFVLI